ncbi:F-box/kelch-repeat protein-like protein [Tanacetum coccineum]|uniref:F-box/kelch-repeat protein-like protein n=1 Tax=Tanacetum coccineum TaxID=301880 RepID=A0ABQ5DC61_9ASTR
MMMSNGGQLIRKEDNGRVFGSGHGESRQRANISFVNLWSLFYGDCNLSLMDVFSYWTDHRVSNYICEELICEIFERLPAKPLIRSRSLSKSWYSHIASSDFIRRHKLRHANKAPKVLIRHVTYGDKVIQDQVINQDISHRCLCHLACTRFLLKTGGRIAIQELNDDIYTLHSEDQLLMYPECVNMSVPAVKFPVGKGNIAGSCNGIICLLNNGKGISLWNPSIRRILTLPDNPFVRTSFETIVTVGFGFDPIIDNYKIVKVSIENLPYTTHNFFVYSMKTETWCAIASPSTTFHDVVSRSCFVNGILHWLVSCDPDDRGVTCYILTFDLSTHVFGMISVPDHLGYLTELTVINSSLAVVSSADDDSYWTGPSLNF